MVASEPVALRIGDGLRPFTHRFRVLICAVVIAAVPLTAGVKLQIRDGRPFVDGVYVNGHGPYRFLVDTGTNMNLIETSLARKIGMDSTFEDLVESAAGSTRMRGSDGNVVELGPVRAERQRFQISGLDSLHVAWPDARGVLGQWFLAGFDYKLDLRGKILEFGKQNASGKRSQFMMLDGRSTVSTSLGELVLDSGAPRVVRFGILPDTRELRDMLTLAGSKSVGMVASTLDIAGRIIWRGDAVAIPDQAEPGVAGLMPLSLFKTVYVCNSERYVVFE